MFGAKSRLRKEVTIFDDEKDREEQDLFHGDCIRPGKKVSLNVPEGEFNITPQNNPVEPAQVDEMVQVEEQIEEQLRP